MTETQDILYNVTGQSLSYVPTEGQPSSVTGVTVLEAAADDDSTAEGATTGSASISSISTTVDQASGQSESDPRKLYVAATTGIVAGDRLLVSSATDTRSEWVEIVGVVSGDYVIVAEPLANDYASSDTVVGTKISISVDSTWVADKSNVSYEIDPNPRYRVRWEYVVGGVTYVQASFFDLVRYRGAHTVVGMDVERAFPGWINSLPTEHRADRGRRIISEAYRQVKMDLYKHSKADQMVRNREAVDHLVLFKANALRVTASAVDGGIAPEAADFAIQLYSNELQHLIADPKVAMDTSGGQGAAERKPSPLPFFVQ